MLLRATRHLVLCIGLFFCYANLLEANECKKLCSKHWIGVGIAPGFYFMKDDFSTRRSLFTLNLDYFYSHKAFRKYDTLFGASFFTSYYYFSPALQYGAGAFVSFYFVFTEVGFLFYTRFTDPQSTEFGGYVKIGLRIPTTNFKKQNVTFIPYYRVDFFTKTKDILMQAGITLQYNHGVR